MADDTNRSEETNENDIDLMRDMDDKSREDLQQDLSEGE